MISSEHCARILTVACSTAILHSRIIAWYMTYTRILGRGYTLEDPDVIASLAVVTSAIVYIVYYVQLNLAPEHYETNMLYRPADVVGLVESCFCVLVCLRDDNWFWFLPLAGQYGIALGRVQVETKTLPQFGKTPILLTSMCRRRKQTYSDMSIHREVITVPIFASPTQQSIVADS